MSIDSFKEKVRWNPWIGILVAIAALFGSQILIGLVLSLYPLIQHWNSAQASNWLDNSIFAQFIFVLLAESLAIVLVLYFLKRYPGSYRAIGLRKPKLSDPLYGLIAFPAYLIIYIVSLDIVTGLDKNLNLKQKQQIGFNNVHGGIDLILAFISLVLLPPIAEEIIFRGLTYSSLKKVLPVSLAVIMTSLLFAAGHLTEGGSGGPLYIAGIDTFCLSLILILLREKTDGLWASMTLHGLKNTIAFAALFALHLN